jgi:hypothetical protein
MRRLLLQFAVLVLSCLCYAQHNTVIVRPKPINDVLQNPNMGITTFNRFNQDPIPRSNGQN